MYTYIVQFLTHIRLFANALEARCTLRTQPNMSPEASLETRKFANKIAEMKLHPFYLRVTVRRSLYDMNSHVHRLVGCSKLSSIMLPCGQQSIFFNKKITEQAVEAMGNHCKQ